MKKPVLLLLLGLVCTILLLPGLQLVTGVITEPELQGVVTVTDKCDLTADSLLSGKFQQCASVWAGNHAGFRRTLIRINNQVTFSLFRISPEESIVLGKDDYLFEKIYINSYLGNDYIGRARIVDRLKRVERFQEILKQHNVDFVLVFTPSKARILSDYLPDHLKSAGQPTNYETYCDVLSKEGSKIHFLDLNRYYQLMRDTATLPLYPKGGTHWTNYSARRYALDTLVKFIGKVRGTPLPKMIPGEITWKDSLENPDEDIAGLLNLFFPYPSGSLPYISVNADSTGAVKPRVLAISDSYFWEFYAWGKLPYVFKSTDFWVWNSVRYPKEKYSQYPQEDLLWLKQDMLAHDVVLLMPTEQNLPTLIEFDERTFIMFDPTNPVLVALMKKRQERIEFYKKLILNDKKWSDVVRQKAVVRNFTFEEMLQRDAEWMLDQEINVQKQK